MYKNHKSPEKFGENIDGIHGVFILLIKDKMAEATTVLRPGVFSWCFHKETNRQKE